MLDAGRLAVLDRRFAAQLTRFPEINAIVLDRLSERAQRLAVSQAISQLNGVDRRLLALFWHLAERWGRVVPGGIAVTLPLPHRLIAELVGARRPTVSTSLGLLAEQGLLMREGETWLLPGEPVGLPTGEAARVIRAAPAALRPLRTRGDPAGARRGGGVRERRLAGARPRAADRDERLLTARPSPGPDPRGVRQTVGS